MDVMDAIRSRRTVYAFDPDRPVAREAIAACLEAAVWAPNHKLTEPWAFYVFHGAAKERLARLRGEVRRSLFNDPDSPKAIASGEKVYREMMAAPVVVLVTSQLVPGDPVREKENYAAVACAIQNFMLAARSMGLGVYWGTGPLVRYRPVWEQFQIPDDQEIVGCLFVGHPAAEPEPPRRTPAAAKTRWYWDD